MMVVAHDGLGLLVLRSMPLEQADTILRLTTNGSRFTKSVLAARLKVILRARADT